MVGWLMKEGFVVRARRGGRERGREGGREGRTEGRSVPLEPVTPRLAQRLTSNVPLDHHREPEKYQG